MLIARLKKSPKIIVLRAFSLFYFYEFYAPLTERERTFETALTYS